MTTEREHATKEAAKIAANLPGLADAIVDTLKGDRVDAAAFHSWALASNANEIVGLLKPYLPKFNPEHFDEDELKTERALDRVERARREAKKYTDKLQGFFERGEQIPQGFLSLHQAAIDKYKKAAGVNPSKRKRKAKANPAPQLPALALLGDVVELRIASHGGARTLRPKGAKLLASSDGKTIVVVRPTSTARAAVPREGRAAGAMFRKWSAFPARRAVRLTLPDKPITVDLGHVEVIRYRSAKWSGKPTLYEHKFTGKNTAIAETYRAPRLIRIEATPRKVIVTERGIVG